MSNAKALSVCEAIGIAKDIINRRQGLISVLTGGERAQKQMENNCLQTLIDAASAAQKQTEVTIQVNTNHLTADLVSLIMRLSWKLGSDQKLTKQAMDFLERKGLVPSPLRIDEFKKLCDEVEMEDKCPTKNAC